MAPRYFFEEKSKGWNRIRTWLNSRYPLVLFLDYDGTMVPIHKRPDAAVLSLSMREILKYLAERPHVFLGLVTGRSLQDIKKMVRLKNIFYIANHGFQIVYSRKNWVHPKAKRLAPILIEIISALRYSLRSIPGAIVENKSLTLSVHYRNLAGTLITRVKRIVENTVSSYQGLCRITKGKKVIEIRPNASWDKGLAVLKMVDFLHNKNRSLIVYIGDDKTDEDAFKCLFHLNTVTIRVGKNLSSRAKYYVNNTAEVEKLLKLIKAQTRSI
jgi:trehalose-phosphatase